MDVGQYRMERLFSMILNTLVCSCFPNKTFFHFLELTFHFLTLDFMALQMMNNYYVIKIVPSNSIYCISG